MENIFGRDLKVEVAEVGRGGLAIPWWLRRLANYGLALLLVAAAAMLPWILPDALVPAPFLAFYLAWVGAAVIGGLGPGLLATVASWVCIDYLYDPAGHLTSIADPASLSRLGVFLAGGLAVSLVAEKMRRGRARERGQARELARAKQEWERTFDAVPDLIAIIDPQHRILRANRTMAERLGASPEACTGLMCYHCVHHCDAPITSCPHDQALADGREHTIEIYEEQLDGYFFITCTPLYDRQGRIIGTVHVARDITARKRAEEALRELNATLESKVVERTAELEQRARQLQKLTLELSEAEDRERKHLAQILHDDLQQILAGAKFHLGLVKNRVAHDPLVHGTVGQVDHLLKDAIDKSRSLSHELSPAVLCHGDLAETLGWLAGEIQAKHGLLVHMHARGRVRSQSDALKAFLFRTAQELLFNVVKHASVSEANVRVRRMGRWIGLSVSDHGRGFDPRRVGQANGFGLFSIRERVELLGGRMKIRSAEGRGSTFFLAVPDGEPPAQDANATAAPTPVMRTKRVRHVKSPDGGRLRVLLADDHEIVREGLISLLREESGVEVVGEASNGREAVDVAGRLEPDVVIMDVSMPLISGDEATRQIKKHLPNTRVVALSMFNEPETIARMRAAGAEAYILKTAPSEDLLAAIRGHPAATTS